MPSPFPGMDPYLEAKDIWPDFHHALAGEIRSLLNTTLPSPYYARLEMRPEIGIADEEEMRHHLVEIRDAKRGHHLITLIEIVSPSNKKRGVDRDVYLQKQREILDSDANLVELDLLRSGERLFANLFLRAAIGRLEPAPDYLILVNRFWHRVGGDLRVEVFPVQLTEMLPVIPIPLRHGEPAVALDLQFVVNRTYDGGPYRRGAVDYSQPPTPPLPEQLQSWAEERLQALR